MKKITVTQENSSGRNIQFKDNYTGQSMTRPQFVNKIEANTYPSYHTRVINGIKTPVSNPDKSKNNNLG